MSMLDGTLVEVAAVYGLNPKPTMVDNECCLAIDSGLAAVHYSLGTTEESTWVGTCLDELVSKGVRGIGRFVRAKNGDLVVRVSDRLIYLTEYVPGTACDGNNTFEVRAVGRLLGEVHRASEDVCYFHAPPKNVLAPSWLAGARERAAYWRLAAHRYRQGSRGEALRLLLRAAEESLIRLEKLNAAYDGNRVLSFLRLSFGNFVYVSEAHTVHLNHSHLYLDQVYVNVGDLLLECGYQGDAGMHFLSAYQATNPLSELEWEMLFAYLSYPHEWTQELDDLTRGRPVLKGNATIDQLRLKGEWIEWLRERLPTFKRSEKGGFDVKSEKKTPEVISPEVDEVTAEKVIGEPEAQPVEPVEPVVDEAPVQENSEVPKLSSEPVVERPQPSIVWKPFPKPLGSRSEEPDEGVSSVEEIPK